uniref:Uncharacterized protein n=1 Tax=Globodera rostochiensis TaxID=31243 RepID=A0A914H191_GLORO
MLFLLSVFGRSLASNENKNELLLKDEMKHSEDKTIAAMLLDVFLGGWRECVDWKSGQPSVRCVPFPKKKPEKCTQILWDKAMETLRQGKIRKC